MSNKPHFISVSCPAQSRQSRALAAIQVVSDKCTAQRPVARKVICRIGAEIERPLPVFAKPGHDRFCLTCDAEFDSLAQGRSLGHQIFALRFMAGHASLSPVGLRVARQYPQGDSNRYQILREMVEFLKQAVQNPVQSAHRVPVRQAREVNRTLRLPTLRQPSQPSQLSPKIRTSPD